MGAGAALHPGRGRAVLVNPHAGGVDRDLPVDLTATIGLHLERAQDLVPRAVRDTAADVIMTGGGPDTVLSSGGSDVVDLGGGPDALYLNGMPMSAAVLEGGGGDNRLGLDLMSIKEPHDWIVDNGAKQLLRDVQGLVVIRAEEEDRSAGQIVSNWDSFTSFEVATGTAGPNTLSTYWELFNVSYGTIYSRGGDDRLLGSDRDDVLIGGAGYDRAKGRHGHDRCKAESKVGCEL